MLAAANTHSCPNSFFIFQGKSQTEDFAELLDFITDQDGECQNDSEEEYNSEGKFFTLYVILIHVANLHFVITRASKQFTF